MMRYVTLTRCIQNRTHQIDRDSLNFTEIESYSYMARKGDILIVM